MLQRVLSRVSYADRVSPCARRSPASRLLARSWGAWARGYPWSWGPACARRALLVLRRTRGPPLRPGQMAVLPLLSVRFVIEIVAGVSAGPFSHFTHSVHSQKEECGVRLYVRARACGRAVPRELLRYWVYAA